MKRCVTAHKASPGEPAGLYPQPPVFVRVFVSADVIRV